jgi:hypothetical protein
MALRSAVNTVAKRVALATAAQVCNSFDNSVDGMNKEARVWMLQESILA